MPKKSTTAAAAGLSEAKAEVRDPILDKEITFVLKVEQINSLLTLLGDLPFAKSAGAIDFFKQTAMKQLQEQAAEGNNAETESAPE